MIIFLKIGLSNMDGENLMTTSLLDTTEVESAKELSMILAISAEVYHFNILFSTLSI